MNVHDEDNLDDYEPLTCDDCGKQDSSVKETYCPFAEDIYGHKVEATLCDDCYYQRCMDI